MDFCTNCGKELNGAAFCTNCGAKVESAPVAAAPTGNNALMEKFNENRNLIIAGAAALLVIIIAIITIASCSGSYKSALKSYINAYKNGDAKKIVELTPDRVVKSKGGKSDYKDRVEDSIENQIDDLEGNDGDIKKLSYKITDADKLDKGDIAELEIENKYRYGKKLGIQQAIDVEVEITIPVDGEKETVEYDFKLVKIGRKWYIFESELYDSGLGKFYQ